MKTDAILTVRVVQNAIWLVYQLVYNLQTNTFILPIVTIRTMLNFVTFRVRRGREKQRGLAT